MKSIISLTIDPEVLEKFDSYGLKRSPFVEKCMRELTGEKRTAEIIEGEICSICGGPIGNAEKVLVFGATIHKICYLETSIKDLVIKLKKE